MRYGFVIDHRKCIGCHACSVACKEENGVPLGVYREWLKLTRPAPGPGGLRRPLWLLRPFKPAPDAYLMR